MADANGDGTRSALGAFDAPVGAGTPVRQRDGAVCVNVRYELRDGVAVVTLARPERRNAIDVDLLEALNEVLDVATDQHVDGLVITGEGPAFCAGVDMGVLQTVFEGDPEGSMGPLVDLSCSVVNRLQAVPCPTIAAVAGAAVGPGMALALACDLRVLGETARFVPGFFKFGGSPDGGVSAMMVRAFGLHRSMSLSLRDTAIPAERLLAEGLAEEVVADDQVVAAAVALARQVAGRPPAALPRLRGVMSAAATNDLHDQMIVEREAVADLWSTNDFRESLLAWVERREPSYSGT